MACSRSFQRQLVARPVFDRAPALCSDTMIQRSSSSSPGASQPSPVILDFDSDGRVIGIE
jgi:hypothetical protein